MLLEKLAKAEQKEKLSEEQNLLLLKRREEDQAKNRYLLHKNDELTRRNEQLQVEVDQLQRERDQPRAQMARLSQQIEELLSARMFSPSQGRVDSARQETLVEPGEELLSSSSSIMVHHGPPAFTALPLQSPDAPVSLQRGLGLPVQSGQDSSATNCKGQQDGGGVMRHKKSGPRHFTIEKHHHECATCGQFFKSELAAKQIPCAYHKKRAMKVPYQFWVQSPCSPGSMSSSQSREQNGQTPKLLFWPCCEQTGSKAKPCCSQHQHKLIAPNCKS